MLTAKNRTPDGVDVCCETCYHCDFPLGYMFCENCKVRGASGRLLKNWKICDREVLRLRELKPDFDLFEYMKNYKKVIEKELNHEED